MERILDILLSTLALVFLFPIFLLVILILKFTGEGEVFFYQKRVGLNFQTFYLIKFVTMLKNSPFIGSGTITLKDDPRILPFGRFLRKTKINELPQLINVLVGDMSVIGPRPQTDRCFQAFPYKYQKEITKVKPGLSGIGSIVFRNEEEMLENNKNPDIFYDEILMPFKGKLESWFVSKKSIKIYILLIVLSIWKILYPRSKLIWKIYQDLPPITENLKKYV